MFRYRPKFTLVLLGILVPLIVALGFLRHAGGTRAALPKMLGPGPARACVTASAQARATARSILRARVRVTVPIAGGRPFTAPGPPTPPPYPSVVSVQARLSRPVTASEVATASSHACARGDSPQAARGAALTRAYRAALRVVRSQAHRAARREVEGLVAVMTPAEIAETRAAATKKALAIAARDHMLVRLG